MSKQDTQNKRHSIRIIPAAIALAILLVVFVAQLTVTYQQWRRAVHTALEGDLRLLTAGLTQRVSIHEGFLNSLPDPQTLSKVSAETVIKPYADRETDVLFVALVDADRKTIYATGRALRNQNDIHLVSFDSTSLMFPENGVVHFAEGIRGIPGHSFLAIKSFFGNGQIRGACIMAVSYQEMLNNVLGEGRFPGTTTRLLDLKGTLLAASGLQSEAVSNRSESKTAFGNLQLILECGDLGGIFWTTGTLLLLAAMALAFVAVTVYLFFLMRSLRAHQEIDKSPLIGEEFFRTFWDISTDGMKLTDRTGTVILVNGAYCALFETSPRKVMAESSKNAGTPGETTSFTKQFDAGTLKVATSQVIKHSDGGEIPVEIMNSYVMTSSGEKLLLSVYRSVADRSNMEERIQEVQRMDALGTFAEEIGNNFRNILGIILNASEMLHKIVAPTETTEHYFTMISGATKRGGDLAADLLVYGRADEETKIPVMISQSINRVQTVMRRILPDSMTISVDLHDNNAAILGNHHHLTQALVNLCLAAQVRMKDKGTITIQTRIVDAATMNNRFHSAGTIDYVAIDVSDFGEPVDALELRRSFEPHFSLQRGVRGVGLRLSVVYRIVTSHRGYLDVSSSRDQGVVFTMLFPVNHYEQHLPTEMIPSDSLEGQDRLILFVDDEEGFRELVAVEMRVRGFRAITASDGLEALAMYKSRSEEIALVISDLSMPNLDGESLFAELIEFNPAVKVIFTTGNIDHRLRTDMLDRGVQDILEKPFSFDELASVMKKVIG
jgi:two-component system, cell cycle sensor histidine kinase and response regulator CckA